MGNLRPAPMDRKDIPFATQRSDSWQYWELPGMMPPESASASRGVQNAVREALREVDRKRRLRDAELHIEEHAKGAE